MEDPIIERPDVNFGHIVNKYPTVEAIVEDLRGVALLMQQQQHVYVR